ncbi:MAG: hypothetical protein ACNA77_07560 [Opitutales bacterium]
MNNITAFSLLIFSLFILGCASKNTSETASDPASETGASKSEQGVRTAYEGQTGPKLLMERYQTGDIEGLRN